MRKSEAALRELRTAERASEEKGLGPQVAGKGLRVGWSSILIIPCSSYFNIGY